MTKQEMIKVIQKKERTLHGFKSFDAIMVDRGDDREYWEEELIKDSREWYGVHSLMEELGIKPIRRAK